MFKVIRDFIDKPLFLVMCDCSCGIYVVNAFEPGPTEEGLQAAFAGQLIKDGWKITLAQQICPAHVKKEADAGRLIVLPDFAAAARLGKG